MLSVTFTGCSLDGIAMSTRTCTKCGATKPLTAVNYNQLPSGGWRGTCKDCMAANSRRHCALDPDKVKIRARKYATQKAAAGGSHDERDITSIRRELGDRCAYCDSPLNGAGEVDHKTPISRGGNNFAANLRWHVGHAIGIDTERPWKSFAHGVDSEDGLFDMLIQTSTLRWERALSGNT